MTTQTTNQYTNEFQEEVWRVMLFKERIDMASELTAKWYWPIVRFWRYGI